MKKLIVAILATLAMSFAGNLAMAEDTPPAQAPAKGEVKSAPAQIPAKEKADPKKKEQQKGNPAKGDQGKANQDKGGNEGAGAGVPVDPQHPPITLTLTDWQVRVVLTPFGWRYVVIPVPYYVVAVWNPKVEAYGYYDAYGVYRLYYPPKPPAPKPEKAPAPRPVKK